MNINGKTRVCGLIGDPVEHTLSPYIHNTIAAELDEDLVYVPFKVSTGAVSDAVKGAYELDILGLNVTVPHKREVIGTLASIDEEAEAIGAVNTLVRTEGGFKGYNTDHIGLKKALARDGISLKGRNVVILGAGGAARSAAFLCAFEDAKSVTILNRSVDKAEALALDVNQYYKAAALCKPLPLSAALSSGTATGTPAVDGEDLIAIQTSSVGLYPNNNDVIIEDCELYDRIAYGFDAIYNPADTAFMKLVRAHGHKASNGLGMLIYQGVAANELWMGRSVPESVTELLFAHIAELV